MRKEDERGWGGGEKGEGPCLIGEVAATALLAAIIFQLLDNTKKYNVKKKFYGFIFHLHRDRQAKREKKPPPF